MIDFKQGLKLASEKFVIHFTEYLTNLFSSSNLRQEKKVKVWIFCSYMKLSVAKLLNNHETTVTKSIKKRPTVMIQHSNSQFITVFLILFARTNLFCVTLMPISMNPVQNCFVIKLSFLINMVLNKRKS